MSAIVRRIGRADNGPEPKRVAHLRRELDALLAGLDRPARVAADPVGLVRRYEDPADQEVAGLLVAMLAYGRASVIIDKAGEALSRLGPRPAQALGDARARRRLRGFVYRFQAGSDIERFLSGVHRVRSERGGLGRWFARCAEARPDGDFAAAMSDFVAGIAAQIRGAQTYGMRYLLPTTENGGAAKRLALYLRWMVRPDDGVDLGTWSGLAQRRLIMPLDTHIARIGSYLGLTSRRSPNLEMARDITRGLARLQPDDPLRYDLALCHLGISGACPSRRVEAICAGCQLRSICTLPRKRA